jgi:C-terminal processing protease CtpA/Prc
MSKNCGLGLKVVQDRQGQFVIEGLAPGGPADNSKNIFPGDVIRAITNKKLHIFDKNTPLEYAVSKYFSLAFQDL